MFAVRSLELPKNALFDDTTVAWPVPRLAMTPPLVCHLCFYRQDQPFKMLAFDFNLPDTTGYTFCWAQGFSLIHAHTPRQDQCRYPPPPADPQSTFWFYFPMSEGEMISDMWALPHGQLEYRPLVVSILPQPDQQSVTYSIR